MFLVGEHVGIVKLKKAYDPYVVFVVSDRIQQLETKRKQSESGKTRRQPAEFKIIKPMPTVAEYAELKRVHYTTTADSLMADAYAEIADLGQEMRDWFDNLNEGLQATEKAERVDEAASNLENIEQQEATDLMKKIEVFHLPMLGGNSRGHRAAAAANILKAVAVAITDYCQQHREDSKPKVKMKVKLKAKPKKPSVEDSDFEELESISSQCEDDACEVENVEFPGMFS